MGGVTCKDCGAELEPEPDGAPRQPCPTCGGTRRRHTAEVAALVLPMIQAEGQVVRLSVSASTSLDLAADAFLGPDAFKDAWPAIAQVKYEIEKYHGSEQELRLILSSAFVHASGHRLDDRRIAYAQYAAAELLHGKQAAAERLRRAEDEKKFRAHASLDWLRSAFGWLFGWLK